MGCQFYPVVRFSNFYGTFGSSTPFAGEDHQFVHLNTSQKVSNFISNCNNSVETAVLVVESLFNSSILECTSLSLLGIKKETESGPFFDIKKEYNFPLFLFNCTKDIDDFDTVYVNYHQHTDASNTIRDCADDERCQPRGGVSFFHEKSSDVLLLHAQLDAFTTFYPLTSTDPTYRIAGLLELYQTLYSVLNVSLLFTDNDSLYPAGSAAFLRSYTKSESITNVFSIRSIDQTNVPISGNFSKISPYFDDMNFISNTSTVDIGFSQLYNEKFDSDAGC
ncbi:hypothetical protein PCE1_002277 [Barthelona sp. PCE]